MNGGDLLVQGSLENEAGSVSIQGGAAVELGVVSGELTIDLSGAGGTLQLDNTVTVGTAAGVDATSSGSAAITITGAGQVTSTGADGIDATSAGGNITITPAGSIIGAATGIFATQNGSGNVAINAAANITITGSASTGTAAGGIVALSLGSGYISVSTASGDTINSGSAGIAAADEATAIAVSAESSVTVAAEGTINSGTIAAPDGSPAAGILAGYTSNTLDDEPEPNVAGNVIVTANADITAMAGDGIRAFNFGTGNVTINDAGGTIETLGDAISGQTSPTIGFGNGLYAFDDGGGNIVVSMASGAVIDSAASGVFASNVATTVLSTSSIAVTADGTINSGTIVAPDESRPAGILAGYNSNDEPETNVAGGVDVANYANITAAAGDGIRAYNFGNGNVTVTDEANSTIKTIESEGQYGIDAFTEGVGSVSVTTSTGDAIDANGSGIVAENLATTVSSSAGSNITVTAYGTINSGTNPTQADNLPAGIIAGYFDSNGTPEPNVDGTVTVNDFANITALSGAGINAFNFGNGNVIVNDNFGDGAVASTTVSGTQYGIEASADSGGSSNVTVSVGTNATVSTPSASDGTSIFAFGNDTGNISISTSAGDSISSGSSGIGAFNDATTVPAAANSTVTVTAAGTINSGNNLNPNDTAPDGIFAGYYPGETGETDNNVDGNVIIQSSATINAAAGSITNLNGVADYGILGLNLGTGNVTISTGTSSLITVSGDGVGIAAEALDGGSASITNDGTVNALDGVALYIFTTAEEIGTVTNASTVSGDGTSADPVVQIITGTGAATLTNSGTIAPSSSSSSGLAISESGGALTIYNTGTITGEVALANTVFNNENGGTWNVSGANTFGSGSNTIDNAGTINVLANPNGNATTIGAAVTGTGSFDIANGATLEFGGSVAAGGIVSFAGSSGALILAEPASFEDQISNLIVGDAIELLLPTSVTIMSAVINGSALDVTESNGNQLSYNIAAASGSLSGDFFAVQNTAGGAELVLTANPPQISWLGTSGGNWTDAGDWSGGSVPNSDDAATINAIGTYQVIISSADATYSLVVDDSGATVAINYGGDTNTQWSAYHSCRNT